jgi:phenolic acid decarboxylase
MTPDKYTPFESKLENMLHGIDTRLHEIKGMVAGMYDQITELEHTAEAVYKTVSYHPRDATYVPDEDWDFLNEED